MKKIALLLLAGILVLSCKTQENSSNTDVITEGEDFSFEEDIVIGGTVINKKREKISYAAVKLIVNDEKCISTSTDKKGKFEIFVDPSKLTDESFLEIVYQGYSKKVVSKENAIKWNSFTLREEDSIVTIVEYRRYYDVMKDCNN
ncbi:hypothetical protein [Aquimarina brevivitae]|uniref:Carboxypeptidase-like protein n=1 Tax=Aquimarina brevivitae TaxID=323412 RepID=A0A4Q7PF10_9FLAO|nr:hypothetical protein [Aquimarina brevivitae]RZS99031.1 hypothetical protein EV197_0235 [Aquimarina brevivitae]